MNSLFDRKLDLLIEYEGLNEESVYICDYQDFEEVPLFSRFDNISFLYSLSFDAKKKILIKKGLETLEKNVELIAGKLPKMIYWIFFIALR
ncbi:MAG: Imm15 family immunity protein [Candidatus Malihini olakiniferum]